MSDRIEAMGEEIVHLDTYVRLNYLGFTKITQKFDRSLAVSGSALFVAGLAQEPFCNVRFDDILILYGLAWDLHRAAKTSAGADTVWEPPPTFIRSTTKFWVRPEKVVRLKTRILKHMPYLIIGQDQAAQMKFLDPFALLALDYQAMNASSSAGTGVDALEESQLLSSIYFDSLDSQSYQERIHRREGARLVRFRWYGENHAEPDKEIFVERKVHHESWTTAQSAKERCIIPQESIWDFMKGKFDIEDYFKRLAAEGRYKDGARKAMKVIAHEVDALIQERKMQPMIRTSYYRCAFQLSTSNDVRISLDTQMTLLNEFQGEGHAQQPWCHLGGDRLEETDVYRFPFAILEVKLQDISEPPQWVKEILGEIDATQVHKFSKFQHAMAFIHPERVPLLPHWHGEFRRWHDRLYQVDANKRILVRPSRAASFLSSRASQCEIDEVPDLLSMKCPASEGHMLKDLEYIDPKSIFANERTLLHYAEKGLYLSTVSIALLKFDHMSAQISGLVLLLLTTCYFLWMLKEYRSRLQRITGRGCNTKDPTLRLHSEHGPAVVAALIVVMLALSVAGAGLNYANMGSSSLASLWK